MTALDDRRPAASGTTNQPEPPADLPDLEDAKHFYLCEHEAAWTGSHGSPWFGSASWWTPREYGQVPVYYGYQVHYGHQVSGGLGLLVQVLLRELTRLRKLRRGWDGRNAKPITPEAVYGTILVLSKLLDADSEPPQFFPLPDGGIQVVWLARDEVEIEVDASGEAHVLATASTGDITEGILDLIGPSDLAASVAVLIKNLSADIATERSRA